MTGIDGTVDIHALAGAYALDAVDDLERVAFARHLARCDACATEVAEVQHAAARLADTTWSAPPPRLRAAVLAQVARTRQDRPGHRHTATPAGTSAVRRWRRYTAAAVAAGVLATGGAVGTAAMQQQRLRDERAATTAARADAERMRAVLAAPDAVVHGSSLTGGGQLTMITSAVQDTGVAILTGAPAVPNGRGYQLWLMEGGTPRPAPVLPAGAGGGTVLLTGVRGKNAVAVTVEPATGSTAPTTRVVAGVPLT
ncbi:anti-sigma factor [Dactylosporangium sp. CA-139114]|uniref:anti-sigma factor n=1 Tax=Dactylosporangium sp. CA-139114 TaxID=3239931 RepID=UPI003D96D1E9